MNGLDNIVKSFAQSVIVGIQNNIRSKDVTGYGPMNTTGTMADSLGYTWDGKKLVIFSKEQYFTVLEDGRKPGKMPPLSPIQQWIENKGIATDISTKSLAYLIGRKIGKEGSLLYRKGGKSGVISEFINDSYVKKNLSDRLFLETVNVITNVLRDGQSNS